MEGAPVPTRRTGGRCGGGGRLAPDGPSATEVSQGGSEGRGMCSGWAQRERGPACYKLSLSQRDGG